MLLVSLGLILVIMSTDVRALPQRLLVVIRYNHWIVSIMLVILWQHLLVLGVSSIGNTLSLWGRNYDEVTSSLQANWRAAYHDSRAVVRQVCLVNSEAMHPLILGRIWLLGLLIIQRCRLLMLRGSLQGHWVFLVFLVTLGLILYEQGMLMFG